MHTDIHTYLLNMQASRNLMHLTRLRNAVPTEMYVCMYIYIYIYIYIYENEKYVTVWICSKEIYQEFLCIWLVCASLCSLKCMYENEKYVAVWICTGIIENSYTFHSLLQRCPLLCTHDVYMRIKNMLLCEYVLENSREFLCICLVCATLRLLQGINDALHCINDAPLGEWMYTVCTFNSVQSCLSSKYKHFTCKNYIYDVTLEACMQAAMQRLNYVQNRHTHTHTDKSAPLMTPSGKPLGVRWLDLLPWSLTVSRSWTCCRGSAKTGPRLLYVCQYVCMYM
jgi:hypothetical protein